MKYAMIFPGQATKIIDPREGLKGFAGAEEVFQEGRRVFSEVYGRSPEELLKTSWQQPAIALHSLAVARALLKEGFYSPQVVAGHSLGAVVSLVFAGVLPNEIGLKVILERACITQKWADQKPGKMAAVIGLCYEDVKSVCQALYKRGKIVVAANYNEPRQIVISGEATAVDEAIADLKNYRPKQIIALPTSVAFHSPLLKEASEEFDRVLGLYSFNDPPNRMKVLVDDNVMTKGPEIQAYMLGHMLRPVFWAHTIVNIPDLGIRDILVVGPGQKMVRMIQRTIDFCKITNVKVACLSMGEEIKAFLNNPFV